MLLDNTSKYKSWNNLKKQINGLLCDSLKGKISYFYTRYHGVHNAYGRATINYFNKEIISFSWLEEMYQGADVAEQYEKMNVVSSPDESFEESIKRYKEVSDEVSKKIWMPEGLLCEGDFINSITIYLKTDIKTALNSENYLLRVFSYMDRRIGKRTLLKIKDEVETLPQWVKQFYYIRCEAEILSFSEAK